MVPGRNQGYSQPLIPRIRPIRFPVFIRITTRESLVLLRKSQIDGKSLIHKYLVLSQSHEATKHVIASEARQSGAYFRTGFLCVSVSL